MNYRRTFMDQIAPRFAVYERYYHFVDSHTFVSEEYNQRKPITVQTLVDAGFVLQNNECECPHLDAGVLGCVLHIATDIDSLCLDIVVDGEDDWVAVINDQGKSIEELCWSSECNYEYWTATRQAMHRLEIEDFGDNN